VKNIFENRKRVKRDDLPGGDGSQGFGRGSIVLNMGELRAGDLLVNDCRQFNSTNIIEIVEINRAPHNPGEIVDWRFYGRGTETHSLWHWELAQAEYRLATLGGRAVNTVLQSVEARKAELAKVAARRERARRFFRKTWAISDTGRLCLTRWQFGRADARAPHYTRTIAEARLAGGNSVRVEAGRSASRWWLAGTGPGFAGEFSKAINTVCTASKAVANAWIKAIQSGNVEILALS
jgi:hypothetical protein